MPQRLGLLAVMVAAVLMVARPAAVAEPTPGLPPVLKVLVAADEMPEMFSFAPSGPPGFERELLEGFCRIHGLELAVVPVRDFEKIIPMLLRGEGDVISGIVDTETRRQRIAFTNEVFPVRHLAVTRRPRPAVGRPEELRTLRVGVIPGTSWAEAAATAGVPPGKQVPFGDATALLAGLRAGKVDAVVMALLDYALAQKRDPELAAGPFVGPSASAAMGVRKDDSSLRVSLNGYLEGLRQARHNLMFKYLSEDALSLIALARRR